MLFALGVYAAGVAGMLFINWEYMPSTSDKLTLVAVSLVWPLVLLAAATEGRLWGR